MDDLVDFLRARLGEDEAVARKAVDGARTEVWYAGAEGVVLGVGSDMYIRGAFLSIDDIGPHIARWDPARVLAEVEAKRARIAWLMALEHDMPEGFPTYDSCRILAQPGDLGDLDVGHCTCGLDAWRSKLLHIEAQPYAEHPAYREEWAP